MKKILAPLLILMVWSVQGRAEETNSVTNLLFLAIEANMTELAAGTIGDPDIQLNGIRADGFAPLHMAAFHDRLEIARLLIEAGAELNLKGDGNLAPLHVAALEGRLEIARLLLDKGANANASAGGLTPYAAAMVGGQFEVMSLIKSYGGQ